MVKRTSRVTMSLAAAALALIVASCTLLGGADLVQCRSNDECATKQCNLETNLCVLAAPDAGQTDAIASDVALDVDGGTACKVHADCLVREACIDNKCVGIGAGTAPCSDVPSDVSRDLFRDPRAVVTGIYVFGSAGGAEVVAADAALNLVNKALELRNDRIRIGAVYCKKSDRLSQSSAKNTVARLTSMGIHSVLGQFEVSELASSAFRAEVASSGMTVMSTLGNAAAIQEPTPTDDVKYRFLADELQGQIDEAAGTNPYDAAIAVADARVTKLYTNAGKARPTALKVGFLVSTDAANAPTVEAGALYTKVRASAALADPTAFSLESPTFVRSIFDTDVPTPANSPADALKDLAPQIIIALGGDEIAKVMLKVEGPSGWNPANPYPVWIVSSRAKFSEADLRTISQKNMAFLPRVIGVDFDGDTAKSAAVRASTSTPGVQAFDTLYDGIFAFTLAALRADQARGAATGPITGAQLRQAFDEVLQRAGAVNTDAVELPGGFDAAVSIVRTNRFVHMRGVTGPFDFPVAPKRGTRKAMATTNPYYCFKPGTQETTHYLDANALQTTCAHP